VDEERRSSSLKWKKLPIFMDVAVDFSPEQNMLFISFYRIHSINLIDGCSNELIE
jgi:hypothetical protein